MDSRNYIFKVWTDEGNDDWNELTNFFSTTSFKKSMIISEGVYLNTGATFKEVTIYTIPDTYERICGLIRKHCKFDKTIHSFTKEDVRIF